MINDDQDSELGRSVSEHNLLPSDSTPAIQPRRPSSCSAIQMDTVEHCQDSCRKRPHSVISFSDAPHSSCRPNDDDDDQVSQHSAPPETAKRFRSANLESPPIKLDESDDNTNTSARSPSKSTLEELVNSASPLLSPPLDGASSSDPVKIENEQSSCTNNLSTILPDDASNDGRTPLPCSLRSDTVPPINGDTEADDVDIIQTLHETEFDVVNSCTPTPINGLLSPKLTVDKYDLNGCRADGVANDSFSLPPPFTTNGYHHLSTKQSYCWINYLQEVRNYAAELCPVDCVIMLERCRTFNCDTSFMRHFRDRYLGTFLNYLNGGPPLNADFGRDAFTSLYSLHGFYWRRPKDASTIISDTPIITRLLKELSTLQHKERHLVDTASIPSIGGGTSCCDLLTASLASFDAIDRVRKGLCRQVQRHLILIAMSPLDFADDEDKSTINSLVSEIRKRRVALSVFSPIRSLSLLRLYELVNQRPAPDFLDPKWSTVAPSEVLMGSDPPERRRPAPASTNHNRSNTATTLTAAGQKVANAAPSSIETRPPSESQQQSNTTRQTGDSCQPQPPVESMVKQRQLSASIQQPINTNSHCRSQAPSNNKTEPIARPYSPDFNSAPASTNPPSVGGNTNGQFNGFGSPSIRLPAPRSVPDSRLMDINPASCNNHALSGPSSIDQGSFTGGPESVKTPQPAASPHVSQSAGQFHHQSPGPRQSTSTTSCSNYDALPGSAAAMSPIRPPLSTTSSTYSPVQFGGTPPSGPPPPPSYYHRPTPSPSSSQSQHAMQTWPSQSPTGLSQPTGQFPSRSPAQQQTSPLTSSSLHQTSQQGLYASPSPVSLAGSCPNRSPFAATSVQPPGVYSPASVTAPYHHQQSMAPHYPSDADPASLDGHQPRPGPVGTTPHQPCNNNASTPPVRRQPHQQSVKTAVLWEGELSLMESPSTPSLRCPLRLTLDRPISREVAGDLNLPLWSNSAQLNVIHAYQDSPMIKRLFSPDQSPLVRLSIDLPPYMTAAKGQFNPVSTGAAPPVQQPYPSYLAVPASSNRPDHQWGDGGPPASSNNMNATYHQAQVINNHPHHNRQSNQRQRSSVVINSGQAPPSAQQQMSNQHLPYNTPGGGMQPTLNPGFSSPDPSSTFQLDGQLDQQRQPARFLPGQAPIGHHHHQSYPPQQQPQSVVGPTGFAGQRPVKSQPQQRAPYQHYHQQQANPSLPPDQQLVFANSQSVGNHYQPMPSQQQLYPEHQFQQQQQQAASKPSGSASSFHHHPQQQPYHPTGNFPVRGGNPQQMPQYGAPSSAQVGPTYPPGVVYSTNPDLF